MLLGKILFSLYLPLLCTSLAKASEIRRKREEDTQHGYENEFEKVDFTGVNICDIPDPAIIYCYCNTVQSNEAEEANCWIFNDTSDKKFVDIWESFASQTRLRRVTLHLRSDGSLSRVPTVAVQFLPDLESFEVQYATISRVHSYAFGNSSSIETISINKNSISSLASRSFANLPSLLTLSLGENQIEEINKNSFVNLPKLQQLFLFNNNISKIADSAFEDLSSLKELALNSNQIESIVPETFRGLVALRKLDLQKNFIQVLHDLTFQDLSSLRELNLKSNSIKYIGPKGLVGLSKLRKLTLEDNKLISLEDGLFKPTKELLYLDLRHNVLETIPESVIKPFVSNLKNESMEMLLTDNIFRCDSRLKWIFKLFNFTKSESLKESLSSVDCYMRKGKVPRRYRNKESAMGIGPRLMLLKLNMSELPPPQIAHGEEGTRCPETDKMKKRRRDHARHHKEHTEVKHAKIQNEKSMPQNDMISKEHAEKTHHKTETGEPSGATRLSKSLVPCSFILMYIFSV